MATQNTHGGAREGAGRPKGERKVPLAVRISAEAAAKLEAVANKSEFIDYLIRQS